MASNKTKSYSAKVQSPRQLKVAALILEAMFGYLHKGQIVDRRLMDAPIAITRVLVSADLKVADCFFMPFNTVYKPEDLLDALDKSSHAIRYFVTQKINLKYSPELRFHYDHGFDHAAKVEEFLRNRS